LCAANQGWKKWCTAINLWRSTNECAYWVEWPQEIFPDDSRSRGETDTRELAQAQLAGQPAPTGATGHWCLIARYRGRVSTGLRRTDLELDLGLSSHRSGGIAEKNTLGGSLSDRSQRNAVRTVRTVGDLDEYSRGDATPGGISLSELGIALAGNLAEALALTM